MSIAIANREPLDRSYLMLIKRFPLRPLRNDRELDTASELLAEIGMKGDKKTQGERDYLDVLGQLIADYEKRSPRIQKFLKDLPHLTSREILQSFLNDHQLSQSELARKIDCLPSVISDFLSGRRGLSKSNALKLGHHFAVSADLFLR